LSVVVQKEKLYAESDDNYNELNNNHLQDRYGMVCLFSILIGHVDLTNSEATLYNE